ncbi:MAG TPA: protein kinase [Gemmatimonadaceae bacterium]|nr:protein kinase [Gemmatimonadaceae bacterium]
MIGSSGTQRIVANHAEGALWTVVQNLVASEYDLCGEWAAAPDGQRVVYVASRRGASQALRLLVVDRVADSEAPGSKEAYEVGFHEILDETIPARARTCPQCSHRLLTWTAVCPDCGKSTAPNAVPRVEWSRKTAQSAINVAIGSESTPLGELPTAGGSLVAIVRDERRGETVALTFEHIENFPGEIEAVPLGPLRRPRGAAVRRPSSPHSGEIGPLAARERTLVSGAFSAKTPTSAAGPAVPDAPLVCPKCQSRYEGDIQFCPVDGEPLTRPVDGSDLVGRVLNDKFRVLQLLGEGGMGRVYLAEHVMIGRRCALKVLSPTLVGHPESIRRFAGEARNASRIAHPNVAIVYDFEKTSDGLVYLVLEFVDGETLGAILSREIWLDVTRAVRIVRDVADGLQAAHDLGIVHRDLKPDNIMIARTATGEDLVKVVDFGIAKAWEQAAGNSRVTRTGFVVGTPRYMSPEQLTDETVDARSDVYSLGCVMYEAITGRSAFGTATEKQNSIRTPRLRDDAPRALDAIIRRAMSRAPAERYQTAQAMRDDLDDLLSKIERRERARHRNAVLRIAAGVLVAAAIGTAGWAYYTGRIGSHQTTVAQAPAAVAAPAPAATPPVAPHRAVVPAVAKTPTPKPAATPARTGSDADRYLATVDSAVRSAWHQALNGTTPTGSERATFDLTIGPAGRVLHVTPVHLSDVPAYDDALGVAVQNIPSFAPPPASLDNGHEGVSLRLAFQGSDVLVHVLDATKPPPAPTTPDQ